MTAPQQGHSCPSAQPDMEGARVFGVLSGEPEAPRVGYLERALELDTALEAALAPALEGVAPTQVLRIAANCEEKRCGHFNGVRCTLADRIRAALPPVVAQLPPCAIRSTCRWYAEQGREICFRCPQITTLNVGSDDAVLREAATPPH